MEEKFRELEADFRLIAEAYEYSCSVGRLVSPVELRLLKVEKEFMRDYHERLKAAKGDDEKFDVFLTLFPSESRVLIAEAFRHAADLSTPPELSDIRPWRYDYGSIRPWRYDYGSTWQATYAVGRLVGLFTYEYGKLKVNGLEFDMTRERNRSITDVMMSFHNVFID